VDKGQEVVIICGTIFRYQDFLAAFLCQCRPKEKLTKEKAVMQGYSPRTLGRFLKKAPQNFFNRLVRANIVRNKSKFEHSIF